MGAKSFFTLPPSPAAAAKAASLCALMALASCISDGPNQVGGDFLSENGVILDNPLYHVTLPSFPVDSFWTSEAEGRYYDGKSSHYGDSILLAGSARNFTAEPRLTFEITDTLFLDSLALHDSALKLSLGFPLHGELDKFKIGATDSLASIAGLEEGVPFEVLSWVVEKDEATDAAWADTVKSRNRRFLSRQDTLALLPSPSAIDTIRLKVGSPFSVDSIQAMVLPNLRENLLASSRSKHLIQLHLRPTAEPSSDSLSSMLRLGGNVGEKFGPLLLFGSVSDAVDANAKNRLQTMLVSSLRQINYRLRYAGSRNVMLTTLNRGLHITIDRQALLDSIGAALGRAGITPPSPDIVGDFDLTYFVPYAKISLPLADTTSLEGNYPVQMRLISSIDTLSEGNEVFDVTTVELGEAARVFVTTDRLSGKALDTISLAYKEVAGQPELRLVTLFFAKDSARNDTTHMRIGESKDWTVVRGSGKSFMTLFLSADMNSLSLTSFKNVRSLEEANAFRDPATGENLKDLDKRIPRFLHPGQASLEMRATQGIQALLNRAASGSDILPELLFQPQMAVDSTVINGVQNAPIRAPYPVLSVVAPKLESDVLTIGLELYLYPLKKR